MKNFPLLLLAVLALSLGGCSKDAPEPSYRTAYAEIPDEHFRLYCLEWFDRDRDGRISADEAKEVREIDCNGRQIYSLEGIGFFTRLEVLNCSDTRIQVLDLSGNKALKRLYCMGCGSLPSLDVSQNGALEILNCARCWLTWLDVTRNGALQGLACSGNPLTMLNVSRNPELNTLRCDQTHLKTLNVSRNAKLTRLKCSYTDLSILDVGRCTELKELECNECYGLHSLDASMCPSLEKLYAWGVDTLYLKKGQEIADFFGYGEIIYKD